MSIVASGFTGTDDEQVAQALDSTEGFKPRHLRLQGLVGAWHRAAAGHRQKPITHQYSIGDSRRRGHNEWKRSKEKGDHVDWSPFCDSRLAPEHSVHLRPGAESNHRHADFQSAAPHQLSYRAKKRNYSSI